MSHPKVNRVTLTDSKITLRVEVTDFQTTEGAIEITGEATQVNGAWAHVSSVADINKATKKGGQYFVDVEGVLTPDHKFNANEDVTISLRVSKTWVTVLGPGTDEQDQGTPAGQIWGIFKEDSQLGVPVNVKIIPYSHPWVYSVTLTGDKMTFHVEVTDLKATTEAIEITGEATQVNGAWARVSSVTDRAKAIPDSAKLFVDVEGVVIPGHNFNANEVVTAFVRVSKTWVTVLGPTTDKPVYETGPIWDKYHKDSQLHPSGS